MQPSSTPPPRRSSRARQPKATFIAWTKSPRPLRLRSLRRDEGRPAVPLAALLLSDQFRGRGHDPAERLRELAGERLAECVLAQVKVQATVDFLDPRYEGRRIPGPVHAGDDERSHAAHFLRREFTAVAPDLQDAFEIPASLLLARIAERGLDPHADSEVLDGLQILEPPERLHGP